MNDNRLAGPFMIALNGETPVLVQADSEGKLITSGGGTGGTVTIISPTDDSGNVLVSASSATSIIDVTPSDEDELMNISRGLYVGVQGDIVVTMANGLDVTLKNIAIGVVHPISIRAVKATGTTASNIKAVY